MTKESTAAMATLASDVLSEKIRPTKAQTKALAACVLVQAHLHAAKEQGARRARKAPRKRTARASAKAGG